MPLGICIILSFILYVNNLRGTFVFDDYPNVVARSEIRSLANIPRFFIEPYSYKNPAAGAYRPLVIVSLALNYALAQIDPFLYHVTNILLHALAATTVFYLYDHLFHSKRVSAALTTLFLFHPLNTEAVNSIVNRSEMLSTLFGISALTIFLTTSYKPTTKRLVGIGILLLLALFSKETAVIFLPIILLYALRKKQRVLLWGTLLTIVGGVYFFLRYLALGQFIFHTDATVVENPLRFAEPLQRIPTSLLIFSRYLGKMISPFNLSADFSYNQIPLVNFSNPYALLGFFMFVGLIIATVLAYYRCKDSTVFLFLSLFLFPFAVTSNILFSTGTIMAERLTYLPLIGAIPIAYVLIKKVYCVVPFKRVARYVGYTMFAILLVVWTIRVWMRNADWTSEDTLFLKTAQTSPNSVLARSNAGAMFLLRGDYDRAKKELVLANAIYDKYPHAVNNLGLIYQHNLEYQTANSLYRKTLEISPEYLNANVNLARSLFEQGTRDSFHELLTVVEEPLSKNPEILDLQFFKTLALIQLGKTTDAKDIIDHFLAPANYGNYYALGLLYKTTSNLQLAHENFLKALSGQPRDITLYYYTALSYVDVGKKDDAVSFMKNLRALNSSPLFTKYTKDFYSAYPQASVHQ